MPTKEEMIIQKFAENVARIRANKGLSLRQVAERCKLDHSKVSRIESAQVNVTLLTIIELAEGLGVQPKQLLDF